MKIKLDLKHGREWLPIVNAIRLVGVENPITVTIETETRTIQQNKAQWPILQAFADQVSWLVNGEHQLISAADWKEILTAAFRKEVPKIALGFDGKESVMIGHRTRDFKRKEWDEWIEFLNWAAQEKGVKIPVNKNQLAGLGL